MAQKISKCYAQNARNSSRNARALTALVSWENISDKVSRKIAARLCSRNYQEFQKHPSFKGVNWQHLEKGDIRIDFPTVRRCMVPSKDLLGQYSPVTSPEAEKRKQKLFSVDVFKVSNSMKTVAMICQFVFSRSSNYMLQYAATCNCLCARIGTAGRIYEPIIQKVYNLRSITLQNKTYICTGSEGAPQVVHVHNETFPGVHSEA